MAWAKIATASWGAPEERIEIWEDIASGETAPTEVALEIVNDPNLIIGGTQGRILEPHLKSQLNFSVRDVGRFLTNRVRSDKTDNTPKVPGDFRIDWKRGANLLGRYTWMFGNERPLLHRSDPVLAIKSHDGCTLLKSVPYSLTGRSTVAEFLYQFLNHVGHDIDVVSACGHEHAGMKQGVARTRAIRPSAIAWGTNDNDMYEVLLRVLRFYGMQLMQVDGAWFAIERHIRGADYVAARRSYTAGTVADEAYSYALTRTILTQGVIDKAKSVDRYVDAIAGMRSVLKLEDRPAILNPAFYPDDPDTDTDDSSATGAGGLSGVTPPKWTWPAGREAYTDYATPFVSGTPYQRRPGDAFDLGHYYVNLRQPADVISQVAEQTVIKGALVEIEHSARYSIWTNRAAWIEASVRTDSTTEITIPQAIQVRLTNTADGQDRWLNNHYGWQETEAWIDIKVPFTTSGVTQDVFVDGLYELTNPTLRIWKLISHTPVILPATLPASGNLVLTARGVSAFNPNLRQGRPSTVISFNAYILLDKFEYVIRVAPECKDVVGELPGSATDRYLVSGDPIVEEYNVGDRLDCHTWPDTVLEYLDTSDEWQPAESQWGTTEDQHIHQYRVGRIYPQRERPTFSQDLELKRDTFRKPNRVYEDGAGIKYIPEYIQYNLRTERSRVIGNELEPAERSAGKSGGTGFPISVIPRIDVLSVATEVIKGVSGEYAASVNFRIIQNVGAVQYVLFVNGVERTSGWIQAGELLPKVITGGTTATRLVASDRNIVLQLQPFAQWTGTEGEGIVGRTIKHPVVLPADGVPHVFVQGSYEVSTMSGYFLEIEYEGDVDTASVKTTYTIPGGGTEEVTQNMQRGRIRVNPTNVLATGTATAIIQGFTEADAMGTAGPTVTVEFRVPGEFMLPTDIVRESDLVGRSFLLQTAREVETNIVFTPHSSDVHDTIQWYNGQNPKVNPTLTFIGTSNTYTIARTPASDDDADRTAPGTTSDSRGQQDLLDTSDISGAGDGVTVYAYVEVMETVNDELVPKGTTTALALQFTTTKSVALNEANKLLCILRGYTSTERVLFFVPVVGVPPIVTAPFVFAHSLQSLEAKTGNLEVTGSLIMDSDAGYIGNMYDHDDDALTNPIETFRLSHSGMVFRFVNDADPDNINRARGLVWQSAAGETQIADPPRIWGTRTGAGTQDDPYGYSINIGGGVNPDFNINTPHTFTAGTIRISPDTDTISERSDGYGLRVAQGILLDDGAPGTTAHRLYRSGDDLYWNGAVVGGANNYVTGGAYSAGTLTLTREGLDDVTITGFATGTGLPALPDQTDGGFPSPSGIFLVSNTVTTEAPRAWNAANWRRLVNGNGIEFIHGEESDYSRTTLSVKAHHGITVNANGVSVDAGTGITVDANGVAVTNPLPDFPATTGYTGATGVWYLKSELGASGFATPAWESFALNSAHFSVATSELVNSNSGGANLVLRTWSLVRPVPSFDTNNNGQVLKVVNGALEWAADTDTDTDTDTTYTAGNGITISAANVISARIGQGLRTVGGQTRVRAGTGITVDAQGVHVDVPVPQPADDTNGHALFATDSDTSTSGTTPTLAWRQIAASDIPDLATVATTGAAADVSGLAAVATSGEYSDLLSLPTFEEEVYLVFNANTLPSNILPDNAWGFGQQAPLFQTVVTWYISQEPPTFGTANPYLWEIQQIGNNRWQTLRLRSSTGTNARISNSTPGVQTYAYCATATNDQPPLPPSTFGDPDQPFSVGDSYIVQENPVTWSNTPPSLTSTNSFLWVARRSYTGAPSAGDAISADWSTPTLLSTLASGALPDFGSSNANQVLTVNAAGNALIWTAKGGSGGSNDGNSYVTSGSYSAGNITLMRNDSLADIVITGLPQGDITGVTAGNGLTGGGASGDVTLNVGAGTGITVSADGVAVTRPIPTYGTAGQILSVNADADGMEWIDAPSGGGTTYDADNRLDASLVGANGNVSNAEYGWLDGVTGPIQTQINDKQATLADSTIGDKAFSNPPSDLTGTEKTAVRTAAGFVKLTKAQYDALATKDADTIYFIV